MTKPDLLVHGMHGLGDNIHQRAVLRKLMVTNSVWLETSWVSVYHDLIAEGLKVVRKHTPLRTQSKNAEREQSQFHNGKPIRHQMQVRYSGRLVQQYGGVLYAMLASLGLGPEGADFRLPVPDGWSRAADALIASWQPSKPLLIYRPLVLRREWFHTERNPDPAAYVAALASIRDRFFVVSIADLVPDVEWIVSPPITADIELHHGELPVEMLAALFHRVAMVYASPGFAVPLAQAVSTPVVCMFGGFENSTSFSAGAKFSRYLGLDVDHPCSCFSHAHACNKTINIQQASAKLETFTDDVLADRSEIEPAARAMEISPEALP